MAGAFYIRECCRENRCFNFTRSKTEHEARRSIARRLIRVALPVSLAGLLVNLSMIIDLVTVVNCLKTALQTDLQTVFSRYAGMLPPEITEQTLPSYLYGSYSGLTLSLFNLIPAFTTALGSSAIPSVTRLYVSGRNSDLSVMITAILKLTFLIAVPAGLGISALAGPILQLLYAGRPYEVLIVIPILKLLGVASMLSAVSIPLNSILQALGRERIPLYLLCGGALIKLSLNILLISRPEINILGVAFGTLGCYLFITLGSLFFLKKQKGIRIPLISIITKPFLGGLLCVSAARIVYARTCTIFSNTGSVCLAILCAVAVYGTVVFLMGAISIGEIKMLFAREKYPVNGLH